MCFEVREDQSQPAKCDPLMGWLRCPWHTSPVANEDAFLERVRGAFEKDPLEHRREAVISMFGHLGRKV